MDKQPTWAQLQELRGRGAVTYSCVYLFDGRHPDGVRLQPLPHLTHFFNASGAEIGMFYAVVGDIRWMDPPRVWAPLFLAHLLLRPLTVETTSLSYTTEYRGFQLASDGYCNLLSPATLYGSSGNVQITAASLPELTAAIDRHLSKTPEQPPLVRARLNQCGMLVETSPDDGQTWNFVDMYAFKNRPASPSVRAYTACIDPAQDREDYFATLDQRGVKYRRERKTEND